MAMKLTSKSNRALRIAFILLSAAFVSLSVGGLLITPTRADASLVSNGASDYVIVIPDDALDAEKTAAYELSDYLQRISGAKLPIVNEEQFEPKNKMLAVGFNKKLPSTLQATTYGTLQPDEIVIAAHGDTLLLGGGRPRGTLYAVYEYLHRLGVRWYTPESVKVPTVKTIALPNKAYRYNPPMISRSQLVGNAPTTEWSARNRLNTFQLWSGMPPQYGGGYGQGPDMHTFHRMLPTQALQEHPEWMAEINGQREKPVGNGWAVCLSNEEVRNYLVERTLEWARQNPDKKGVWLSLNDGTRYCTCDKCVAFYKAHGNKPSSLLVQLINELAERMQKEMPDRIAKTLAYSWSLEAPENMRLADNVMIMFCPNASAFVKPLATDRGSSKLRKAIADWRKISKHLEVLLYSAPYDNYWFVEASTYSAAENIQWAYRNGVTSVHLHVSGFGDSFGSESMYLRSWVYARLSWDPTQDIQALIDDFARGYYGPAADSVLKAIKLVHTGVLDKNGEMRLYNDSLIVPHQVNPKSIRTVNELYQKTYDAMDDPVYKKRLGLDWIAYLWTDFWLGFSEAGRYDSVTKTWSVPLKEGALRNKYGKLAKRFMKENKINALREMISLNPDTLAVDKMGVPWKAVQLQDKNVQAVVVPEVAGKIIGFRDRRASFEPFKPYFGFLITQYPLFGSWRDTVNGQFVTGYKPTATEGTKGGVSMTANVKNGAIEKRVAIQDETLQIDLKVSPPKTGPVEIESAFMLDIQDKGFGDHPSVYVEKRSGEWTKRVMGTETTAYYIADTIDLTNATGRIIIAAEKRPEGILITYNPAQVGRLSFWYDSYVPYPADQARMVQFTFSAPKQEVATGNNASLALQFKILTDTAATLTQLSQN